MTYPKPIIPLFSGLTLSLLLLACVEEITLAPADPGPYLVIEGAITNERLEHTVSINYSSYFGDEVAPEPVSGLQVILKGPGADELLRETAPGVYRTDSLAGIPGAVYTLEVYDGNQRYSARDTMPPLPSAFEPVRFSRRDGVYDFEFRRHQFGFAHPNRWELHILRDSIPDALQGVDPDRLGQQVGIEVSDNYAYYFTYFTHPNVEVSGLMNFDIPHFYGFQPGFRVLQKKYAFSSGYYRFLRSVFMETEWRGTLFATTPANINGNFNGGALGYFSALSVVELAFEPE